MLVNIFDEVFGGKQNEGQVNYISITNLKVLMFLLQYSRHDLFSTYFNDICLYVFSFLGSKDIEMQQTCLHSFPILANYSPEKFLAEESDFLNRSVFYMLEIIKSQQKSLHSTETESLVDLAFIKINQVFIPYSVDTVSLALSLLLSLDKNPGKKRAR